MKEKQQCSFCSYSDNKLNLKRRLKKIEGQVKGIHKMVEQEQYCVDILIQIAAVRAALNKVGLIILDNHTRGCVVQAMKTDDQEDKINELIDTISKFIR